MATTPKPRTAKPAAAAKPAAKAAPRAAAKAPAAKPAAAKPPAAKSAEAKSAVPKMTKTLRVKDLVLKVAETSSVRKKDIRPVVEAALKIMGDELASGTVLALPPFGRLSLSRTKASGKGDILITKLKRGGGTPGETKPSALAEDDE